MIEIASLQLLTVDGRVITRGPGELLTVGRGGALAVTLQVPTPRAAAVGVSGVALEVYCHDTNLAVRVHQRSPGYLIVDRFDSFTSDLRRETAGYGTTVLADGPLLMLALRLGDGTDAVEVSLGDVRFTPTSWHTYGAAEATRVSPQIPPREQWARWVVTAHKLWVENGRRSIPTENATKQAMRDRFAVWPTRTPAEPARAVREALYFYGLDPNTLSNWHSGLAALFDQGWPRQSLVEWVDGSANEVGWAPVGLGGRQGPRAG